MGVTTVRLPADIEKDLETLAGKLKRSKGWLINEAVSTYLQQETLEQHRWQETLSAMESAAQGKVVPAEEVHAWLSSWGSNDEHQPPKSRR